MKHTFELPKTERKKIMTFGAFKENKAQDPKNALKEGGKAEKLEKGKDNTSKQGMSKDLKVNKATYESYTEIGDMKQTLTEVKQGLENNVTELQRVSSDLYRKGFETYSEKVERVAQGISNALQDFESIFTDLDNEEPTDISYPGMTQPAEVVTEAQGADAVKELDKQIAELEKQKKQHEMQAAQLSQQVNQLIIQRANVEIAAAKTNMQQTSQPGQAQPGQPTQTAPQAQPTQTQPTTIPPNPIS